MTDASAEPVPLDIDRLTVRYPRRTALLGRTVLGEPAVDDVSLTIVPGATVGLVGESGSGKSTLGRAVLRLIPITNGRITLGELDITAAHGESLRRLRRSLQIVFQDPAGSLNPRRRVGATITEPLIVHRLAETRKERARRVAEVLDQCGMPADAAERYPHEFSGGQRQRLAIARALVLGPSVLVLDEPTSALDVSVQAQILNLLNELQARLGLTYLFISHDLGVVEHLCSRVAVMRRGKIVETGPTSDVLNDPQHEYTRTLLDAIPAIPA